jgi:hypothetical protein
LTLQFFLQGSCGQQHGRAAEYKGCADHTERQWYASIFVCVVGFLVANCMLLHFFFLIFVLENFYIFVGFAAKNAAAIRIQSVQRGRIARNKSRIMKQEMAEKSTS